MLLAEKLQDTKLNQSSFYDTLLVLAIPIMIQNLITSSINMIDTVMIGKIGETEIAAVGIANQYFFLFNLIIVGITSGGGIFISQYWGQKDKENILKTVGISLFLSIGVSITFMLIALIIPEYIVSLFNKDPYVIQLAVDYLLIVSISYVFTAISLAFGVSSRCVEDSIVPMLVSTIALFINASLNYIFIFGYFGMAAMGVKGAALATLIARTVETIILLLYIYVDKDFLAVKWKNISAINKSFVQNTLRTIIPVVTNDLCWALGMIIYAIAYGHIGTRAMAAVQITGTVQNVFMVFTFGVASASAVMIGNQIGANNIQKSKEYKERFIRLATIIGIIIGLILALSTPKILTFFNVSPEVHNSALKILYIYSIMMPVKVLGVIIIVGILRGGGDASYALKIEASTMWLVGVPLVFLGSFILKFPVEWVMVMVTLEEITKMILGLKRLRTSQWIRRVI